MAAEIRLDIKKSFSMERAVGHWEGGGLHPCRDFGDTWMWLWVLPNLSDSLIPTGGSEGAGEGQKGQMRIKKGR